jgi:NADPH:quinone reductase-like Zn-dependent oxidoreductase
VVPLRNVVPVGDEGDAAQLAQLSINPATAYVLLLEYGSLRPGDWIGQTIGNSAVGRYVIQLASRAGYRTLSVVRREKAAGQVRAAGGDLVVVSGEDLATRVRTALDGRQLDLVLEGEGGETVGALASSMKDGGTVAMYSTVTGASPVIGPADLVYRGLQLAGWWLVTWLRTAPREEIEATYAELAALVAKGEISSPVEATYPLSAYREAIAHAAAPGRSGKILFTFDAGR